jgi:hypothetical protein
MDNPVPQPKTGFNTTEFWLVVPVIATSIYGSVQGFIPQPWGIVVAAAVGSLYGAFRSWLKVAHAQGMLSNVPDLPDASAPAKPGAVK